MSPVGKKITWRILKNFNEFFFLPQDLCNQTFQFYNFVQAIKNFKWKFKFSFNL